jgi:phage-related protein
MREIILYETASGKCPVETFLDSLNPKQAQKITWTLQLIEELPKVPAQYFKKLVNTDEIWEIRVIFKSDIFRLLGFFDGNDLIVLNHAFQKRHRKLQNKQ